MNTISYNHHRDYDDNDEQQQLPVSYLLTMIPMDILSNIILGQYCSGKTISTFMIVLESCCTHLDYDYIDNNNQQQKNKQQQHPIVRKQQQQQQYYKKYNNTKRNNKMLNIIIRCTFQTRYEQLIRILQQQVLDIETGDDNDEIDVFDDLAYIHHTVLDIINDNDDDADDIHNDGIHYHHDSNTDHSIIAIQKRMKYISNYCAIIDYFELHSSNNNSNNNNNNVEYIIWIGPLHTSHGTIASAILTCSTLYKWTATSLLYWYHDYEIYEYTLTTPYRTPNNITSQLLYGSLRTYNPNNNSNGYEHCQRTSLVSSSSRSSSLSISSTIQQDNIILHNLYNALNDEYDPLGRYSLVPRHLGYDVSPSISFTKKSNNMATVRRTIDNKNANSHHNIHNNNQHQHNMIQQPQLNCYWDQKNDDRHDWEEGMDELGDNVIRILNRLSSLLLVSQHNSSKEGNNNSDNTKLSYLYFPFQNNDNNVGDNTNRNNNFDMDSNDSDDDDSSDEQSSSDDDDD